MKPWFIREDNVVPFPKKDKGVVRLPNVNAYPDFLTGVQDLQNHLKRGDISSDIHKKLYQDLIHRFMKTESFETPWFLREYNELDQKKMQFINDILQKNPNILNDIYKKLKITTGDETDTDKINPKQLLDPIKTAPEKDHVKEKGFTDILIKSLMNAQGDYDDAENFLKTYGKANYINTEILQTLDNPVTIDSWLQEQGKVSKNFIKGLFLNLFNAGVRGPGELALALLSPQIELLGKGDLSIGNIKVELKGQSGGKGGRFKDTAQSFGQPDLSFLNKINNLPENLKITDVARFTGAEKPQQAKGKINVILQAQALEKFQKGLGAKFLQQMVQGVYNKLSPDVFKKQFANWQTMSALDAASALKIMSYQSYVAELKSKGFEHILLISPTHSLFFNVKNYPVKYVHTGSVDYGDIRNGPAAQISLALKQF